MPWLLILKILGCSLVIYVIGMFIASIKKLLPLLTIIGAVAAIGINWYIYLTNRQDLQFLYIVALIFMNFCYVGESFFSYRVVKNTYVIVGIERKWKYLVEEDDEYVIHYTPVEAGGFFSNLLSSGLIFTLYSMLVFPENVTIGYIVPVYYLFISILDLINLFLFPITGILRFLLQAIAIITSPLASVYMNDIIEKIFPENDGVSYILCKMYSNINYDNNYYYEYSEGYMENKIYIENENIKFIYNKELDACGYFTEYVDIEGIGSPIFDSVIYKDHRFESTTEFVNKKQLGEYNFYYEKSIEKIGGILKYKPINEEYDFEENMEFNKEIFESSKTQFYDDYVELKNVVEEEKITYVTYYRFEINEDKKVVGLYNIECDVFDGKEVYKYIYKSIKEEKDVEFCFFEDYEGHKMLKGYIINPNDVRKDLGYYESKIDENVSEDVIENVQEKLIHALDEFSMKDDKFYEYDHMLETSLITNSPKRAENKIYLYDKESNMTACYFDDLLKGVKASLLKDTKKYEPDILIYNDEDYAYDLVYKEKIDDISELYPREWGTLLDYMDHYDIFRFNYYYEGEYLVARYQEGREYKFYLKEVDGEFEVEKLDIYMETTRLKYHATIFINNEFDVTN